MKTPQKSGMDGRELNFGTTKSMNHRGTEAQRFHREAANTSRAVADLCLPAAQLLLAFQDENEHFVAILAVFFHASDLDIRGLNQFIQPIYQLGVAVRHAGEITPSRT